jgi:hypothetical protein
MIVGELHPRLDHLLLFQAAPHAFYIWAWREGSNKQRGGRAAEMRRD